MLISILAAILLAQPGNPGWRIDASAARRMSTAVFVYAQEHNGQLPPDMPSMMEYLTGDLSKATPEERAAAHRQAFFSSQDQDVKIPADATAQWLGEHSSFTYLGLPNLKVEDLPSWNDLAILHVKFDKAAPGEVTPGNPEGRIYTVSFVDGHTEAMNRADAERVIAESTAIYRALSTGAALPEASQCILDLRAISAAIHAYAKAHEGDMPPDLGSTLAFIPEDKRRKTAASRAAAFLSPGAQKTTHIPEAPTPEWVNEHTSYIYLGAPATKLDKIAEPDYVVLLHGHLDAPIEIGAAGRRGANVPSFPVLFASGEGALHAERFTRWVIDVSKRAIDSARTGAPLPDHLNGLHDCRVITMALIAYAKEHNNMLPPDLGATLEYLKLGEGASEREKALVFLSPKAERSTGIPEAVTREWVNRYTSYTYLASSLDLKLVREAGIQWLLHGPLDEAWDIMERGNELHAVAMGHVVGGAMLMDQESARTGAAESKQSLDAIRAGVAK
jgi:hypothetical protein